MKLKYYLRGLGIGIIVTTIVLTVSNAAGGENLTDAEIIERAEALGMVMEESDGSRIKDQIESTEEETQSTEAAEDAEETQNSEETNQSEESEIAEEEQKTEETVSVETTSDNQETVTNQPDTTAPYMLVVNAGAVCRELCDELQQNGVIDDSEGLRKYLGDNGYAKQICPGNYEIPYGSSYEEIAQILLSK